MHTYKNAKKRSPNITEIKLKVLLEDENFGILTEWGLTLLTHLPDKCDWGPHVQHLEVLVQYSHLVLE